MKNHIYIVSFTFMSIPLCNGMQQSDIANPRKISVSQVAQFTLPRELQPLLKRDKNKLTLLQIGRIKNAYSNMLQCQGDPNQALQNNYDEWNTLYQTKERETQQKQEQQEREKQWQLSLQECIQKSLLKDQRNDLIKQIFTYHATDNMSALQKTYNELIATYPEGHDRRYYYQEECLQDCSDIQRSLGLKSLEPQIEQLSEATTYNELNTLAQLIEKKIVFQSQSPSDYKKDITDNLETLGRIYRYLLPLAPDDTTRGKIADKLLEIEI